jgi:hypothetical protein
MPEKKDFVGRNADDWVVEATYFYVRPGYAWQDDFD